MARKKEKKDEVEKCIQQLHWSGAELPVLSKLYLNIFKEK